MKKKINIICQLLACILIFSAGKISAQTGILTQNPATPLHIDAKNDESGTAGQITNDVVVTADGKLGVGLLNPATKVDLRPADPTDQKGIIGVGTNTQTANIAGAGAIRYNTAGYLEYSDGENWIALPLAAPTKALVNATKNTSQSVPSGGSTSTTIIGWTESIDTGGTPSNPGGDFNISNGEFKAPRTGFYLVSFNITLTDANIPRNSFIETAIEASNLTTTTIPKFVTVNSYPAYQVNLVSNFISGNCNGIFYLNKDAILKFTVKHNTGNRNVYTSGSGRFNNVSISEL